MNIYNSTKKSMVASDVKIAQNFITRSLGLLPKNNMSQDECLIIRPCCSIHTFFMKFAIDVLFIDRKNEIIALHENVKPWRILPIHLNSEYVIELASGQIAMKNICLGDIISKELE